VVLAPVVRFAPTDVACPTTAEVQAQLAAVLSTSGANAPLDVATLERTGPTLSVRVNRPDGTPVGRRTFEGAHPCADLASAVALTIATWESDVHPEFVLAPPPLPEDARRGAPAPVLAPPEAPASVETVVSPPERTGPPVTPAGLDVDLGAALGTQATPSPDGGVLDPALALGLTVVGGVAPADGGLGARLALGASTERAVPLADGQARWFRVAGSVGPTWRLRLGSAAASAPSLDARTAVDLHAEIALGALHVRGSGFSSNASGWSFDVGGAAGVRVWLGQGRWRPSIDLGLAYWPRENVAYASPSAATARLPRVDVSLALGISLAGAVTKAEEKPAAARESAKRL